jgi:hypothetical protein
VAVLLESAADPNAISEVSGYGRKYRMTPLHYAAQQGHEDVVRALLDSGAKVGVSGGWEGRETAYDMAKQAGHVRIASILASASKQEYPTAMAFVMARTMKRLAGEKEDLGLARRAKELHAQATSAIKKRHSVLTDENPKRLQTSLTPTPSKITDSKSSKAPARLPTPPETEEMLNDAHFRVIQEAKQELQAQGQLPFEPMLEKWTPEYRWAQQHLKFLEDNRPDVFAGLRQSGDLNSYLCSVGEDAERAGARTHRAAHRGSRQTPKARAEPHLCNGPTHQVGQLLGTRQSVV